MKIHAILLFFLIVLFSCSPKKQTSDQEPIPTNPYYDNTATELTSEQRKAFDTLNVLQINTDEQSRIYSTFADIRQPCYPPDTSFVISQSEFHSAMQAFLAEHCTEMDSTRRKELGNAAVLSQKQYKVLHCSQNLHPEDYTNGLPRNGIWVMPSVLGRRDILLVW